MHTIILEGKEYILRCDLNVVEAIEAKYGGIEAVYGRAGEISVVKYLVSAMINEHYYAVQSPVRLTENRVGMLMTEADVLPVMREVLAELSDCVAPKNV